MLVRCEWLLGIVQHRSLTRMQPMTCWQSSPYLAQRPPSLQSAPSYSLADPTQIKVSLAQSGLFIL